MPFNYTNMLNVASRLLTRFGGSFSYTANVTGTYDPVTRAQAGSNTTVTVTGVFVGAGKKFIDGTVVEIGQGRFLLDAKGLTITPSQGDEIAIKGVDYFVDDFDTIDPSGLKVVLYILNLKAGSSITVV